MCYRIALIVLIGLTATNSVHAARLVVMSTNSNPGVSGYKAFTIGVQVALSDLAQAGANPVLKIHNFTLPGVGGVSSGAPYQALTTKGHAQNQSDIQGIQSTYIDNIETWPPSNAGLAGDSSADAPNGITSLYRDSWWYSSSASVPNTSPAVAGGTLVGYNDAA